MTANVKIRHRVCGAYSAYILTKQKGKKEEKETKTQGKQQLRATLVRGHCLEILIVLAAVHGLLGLPGLYARSSLHSCTPQPSPPLLPTPSPSLIGHLTSVDVKQNVY